MAETGLSMWVFRPSRRRVLWTMTAVFVTFVAVAFFSMSNPLDLQIYHIYASTAARESLSGLYQTCKVEYPPLAIGLMLLTEELANFLPPAILPYTGRINQRPEDIISFKVTYRLEMAACILLTWGMVIVLLRKHFAHETPGEWLERLLAFTICLAPLGYVLLDRLDIAMAALVIVSLALLLSQKHYAWSYAVLSAAIAFKFVPIALVPIWIMASLPASTLSNLGSIRGWGRFLAACLVRAGILAGFLAALCAPLWIIVGPASFKFFSFHSQRGLEFESSYAAVLNILKQIGYPVRTFSAWGSADLVCSASPFLTQLSAVLVALSLLAGGLVLFRTLIRRSHASPSYSPKSDGPLVVGHVLWALLAFVLFNKVCSPQYMLWLVPLVAIVPLSGMKRRLFQGGFFGVTYLTMQIFPRNMPDVVGIPLVSDPSQSTGANALGTGLLAARLVLLVILTAVLANELRRRSRNPQAMPVKSTPRIERLAA